MQHTICAKVHPRLLTKADRLFTGSMEGRIIEILQNARRAGATEVIITNKKGLVTVQDNGSGIDDFQKLLDLGGSGWDEQTELGEDPAGVGLFSLAPRKVTILSKNHQVVIENDGWTGTPVDVSVSEEFIQGTKLVFQDEEKWDFSIVEKHAVFSGMKVTVDSKWCHLLPFCSQQAKDCSDLVCWIEVVSDVSQYHKQWMSYYYRSNSSISDGAGGGGAGGTIILHAGNYSGPVTVEANGGNGGHSNDGGNIGRCFGGGGGGSGGVIYFTGSLPAITTNVTGGAAGIESGRDVSCNPVPQAAAVGTNGQVIPDYIFTRSSSPAGYCTLLLPADLISFTAAANQQQVQLKWEVTSPELISRFTIERKTGNGNWEKISEIPANETQSAYRFIDQIASVGHWYYRLRIIWKDQRTVLSAIRSVQLKSANAFSFYPNPAKTELYIVREHPSPSVLKLMDFSGKTILQQELQSTQLRLALPELAAGIYLLSIDGEVKKLQIR